MADDGNKEDIELIAKKDGDEEPKKEQSWSKSYDLKISDDENADPKASAPPEDDPEPEAEPYKKDEEKHVEEVAAPNDTHTVSVPGESKPRGDEKMLSSHIANNEPAQVLAIGGGGGGGSYMALKGKFLELDVDGEIVHCKVNGVSDIYVEDSNQNRGKRTSRLNSAQPDGDETSGGPLTKKQKRKVKVENLIKESTNRWLYVDDDEDEEAGEQVFGDKCKACTTGCVNKFIAITVILIQIGAYIAITYFLYDTVDTEQKARAESCYGINCDKTHRQCITLSTGALISVMLIGFLWADVINVLGICRYNFLASGLCTIELLVAIVCGFITGLYSESDFDAIGGAVGILFVHDLDERVFASMEIISRRKRSATFKKILAVVLWIVVSLAVSIALACRYSNGLYSATPEDACFDYQFQCASGDPQCIWEGFECNGVEDCSDGSDEGFDKCDEYAFIDCASQLNVDKTNKGLIKCLSTGTCLSNTTRCNGILDCPDGTDEGRPQNCTEYIETIKCDTAITITTGADDWTQVWTGQFKCNNGQCIDAAFACDGIANDCVDGSDEYPNFDQTGAYPFLARCPYSKLITCSDTERLCKTDGQCIAKSKVCDGTADCDDGQDEQGCEYTCPAAEIIAQTTFQCGGIIATINATHIIYTDAYVAGGGTKSYKFTSSVDLTSKINIAANSATGACITNNWRCDGLPDCADNSDETDCLIFTCAADEYQCPTSGACISQDWLCDYTQDCDDGKDEDEKTCADYGKSFPSNDDLCEDSGYGDSDTTTYAPCPEDVTICIPDYYFCDNYQDCPNNQDEVLTECQKYGQDYSNSPAAGSPAGAPYSFPASAPGSFPASAPGSFPASSPNSFPASAPGSFPAGSPVSFPAAGPASGPVSGPSGSYISLGSISCNTNTGALYLSPNTKHGFTFTQDGVYTNFDLTTCTIDTNFDTKIWLYESDGSTWIDENDDISGGCGFTEQYSSELITDDSEMPSSNDYVIVIGAYTDGAGIEGVYSVDFTCY